mgnify:CR=1 FL=1
MRKSPQKLDSIQALRAVAALAVVLGHIAQLEMRFLPDPVLGPYWLFGFSGVDLFFVISGFVMVHVTRGIDGASGHQAGRFLFARVTRIYPPYWLFTLIALAGLVLVPGIGSRGLDDVSLWGSFLLIPDRSLPILPVGWTLDDELYFYIVFSALLFVPRRFLPAALVIWMAIVLLGDRTGIRVAHAGVNLVFNPLTIEFGMGCALALLRPRGGRIAALIAIVVSIITLCVAAWFISPQSPLEMPEDWLRVVTQGFPCALLVYAVLTLERIGDFRSPRFLVVIGDWSYSLYLSHVLVLLAGTWLWGRFVPDLGPVDNLAMIALGVVGTVAVSGVTYRLFEKPVLALFHQWRDRLFPVRPVVAAENKDDRVW